MSFKAIVINQVVYVVPSALSVPAALADKVLPVVFPGAWDKAPPVPNETVLPVETPPEVKPTCEADTVDMKPHASRKHR